MYLPSHFAEARPEQLHALMRQHPLATLVWLDQDAPVADHIPLEFVPDPAGSGAGTLQGHVARANPLWQRARRDQPLLAVFQGPQAYVSPSWYPSKAVHGKVVPTWNYAVVHARCDLVVHDDAGWVRGLVERLTRSHEAQREHPWQVADAPADYLAATLRAIVGIELRIQSLTGKWKLSQNRDAADRQGVVQGLAGAGDTAQAMAALVARGGAGS